jgi:hypothetical protein
MFTARLESPCLLGPLTKLTMHRGRQHDARARARCGRGRAWACAAARACRRRGCVLNANCGETSASFSARPKRQEATLPCLSSAPAVTSTYQAQIATHSHHTPQRESHDTELEQHGAHRATAHTDSWRGRSPSAHPPLRTALVAAQCCARVAVCHLSPRLPRAISTNGRWTSRAT